MIEDIITGTISGILSTIIIERIRRGGGSGNSQPTSFSGWRLVKALPLGFFSGAACAGVLEASKTTGKIEFGSFGCIALIGFCTWIWYAIFSRNK
jgi:hypothetical protein